jgi:cobalt-zinc-cadmium efflux system outer membrane protein
LQYHKQTMKTLGLATAIIGTLISGCAYQSYTAKPLDITAIASEFRQHDPSSQDFQAYLKSQGYTDEQLPLRHWSLNELTYSALYFHADLDVARAMWRAAQAGERIAGQRPNPGVSGDIERHSDTENGISPWTFGLAIDIPIETGGKRQARMDRASSLSEASRIDIAQTAWKVRSRVHASWIAYQAALSQTRLLGEELSLRSEISGMLEARLRAGMVSSLESANARLLAQKTRQLLDTEKANLAELKSRLASHAGLSIQGFNKINLADVDKALVNLRRESLIAGPEALNAAQETALLNRLDIRAALARYDAAEAKLRLEIARQYPDIVLSPGYSYDQGDKIWSIGISTLLSLLNKNEGNIAEAEAQREVEAAKFRALQTGIIGELESRKALYLQTLSSVKDAERLLEAQVERTQLSEKQFDQGIIDRLELTAAKLENLLARQNLILSETRVQRAGHALEEIMQYPLENPLPMPSDPYREATSE